VQLLSNISILVSNLLW